MNSSPVSPQLLVSKQPHTLFVMLCYLFIALLVGIGGYLIGYRNGTQQSKIRSPKITTPQKNTITPTTRMLTTPYALSYSVPSGWRTIQWHPAPNSTASAIASPDYTSFNTIDDNPTPQTGIAIFISRYSQPIRSLQQLKSKVEESEDNMQSITQIVVGGFPAYHAVFVSSDSNRVLDDYHILKGTDDWVINCVFTGNSLPTYLQEKQRYIVGFNELLQSIQFQ